MSTTDRLKIETVNIDQLNPNQLNSKLHPAEQVDQIAASIEQFGNCDPLGVWTDNNGELVIVEGHGRYAALRKLGITEVPVIRLDHLSDEQRRAYGLVHNKLTMSTGFDQTILAGELAKIKNIDMAAYDLEITPDTPSIDSLFNSDKEPKPTKLNEPTIAVCPFCGYENEVSI